MNSVAAFNANDPYELLIAQIISIERQPQNTLRQRRSDQTVFKAVLNDFDSALSALNSSLDALTDAFANPFAARAATVPEGAGFGVAVTDLAAPGSHTLEVERLASADARLSQQFTREGTSLDDFFDANGAQTFTIEVASPTEDEPERRVGIEVTVDPPNGTDEEILDEIETAIDEAMDAAVDDGTIQRGEVANASVVNETSETARLSLRSGTTGFQNRLDFTDSEGGLLSFLQVNSDGLVGEPVTTTTPATAASFTGDRIDEPVSVGLFGGDLDIEVNGTAYTLDLGQGSYTADDLATALGDEIGGDVTVEVVDGALQITTAATGQAASLQVTGGSLVDAFGFEVQDQPVTGTDATTETQTEGTGGQVVAIGTSETDSALNARFQLDGLTLYRPTNEVDDALDGVTFSLDTTGEATAFSIGSDGESVTGSVKKFIKDYNAVLGFIERKSAIDAEAGTRGDFAGDSSIRSLRFGMRNDAAQSVESALIGAPEALADLGIEINNDGTLKLADQDALTAAAAANPDAVQGFFSGDEGLGTRLQSRLDTFLGTDGILKARTDSIDERLRRLDGQIERWDERLDQRAGTLRAQYASLQETIALVQGQQQSIFSFFG